MHFFEGLSASSGFFLLVALALAVAFEFANGFHDTAIAVATVIYTNSMKPIPAVLWSAFCNFVGVLLSAGAVAYGIVALLPIDVVLNADSGRCFAMVFALLLSAILWNLGTWYLGLPASSSHTLVGSIMGVGLGNALLSTDHSLGEAINWLQAKQTLSSLLISPILGFTGAALLLLLARLFLKKPNLFKAPENGKPPPLWIRSLLVCTCTSVSLAHGSNDGQKGMGLIMLILIGILPGAYALNPTVSKSDIHHIVSSAQIANIALIQRCANEDTPQPTSDYEATEVLKNFLRNNGKVSEPLFGALSFKISNLTQELIKKNDFFEFPLSERQTLRKNIYLITTSIEKLNKLNRFDDSEELTPLLNLKEKLDPITRYIPAWVKAIVAFALGLGTMVGWRRITVTLGEKIGKENLTYAQGACAELVAAGTIFAGDRLGLPISTTHVVSSGIAGTMVANQAGLQMRTVRNILLAWVFTLPACIFLGAGTFSVILLFVFNLLGLK